MTPPAGLSFQRLTASQAREQRETVEDVFRRSYVEAIDAGDLFEAPAEFMHRFGAYTSPTRAGDFELVFAYLDGKPVGQTWGWPLLPDTIWWQISRLDIADTDLAAFTHETGNRTFALSEIMVCNEYAGRGIARALQDELLNGRREQRATLLVDPQNSRAYNRYSRWGWRRVGTMRPDWPDAPTFDVLVRSLM
ncbi:GNAT family N-acetyltransferase [Nocardia sp. NBC_01327]|uniref:GNAT family N-acetyltransferase n=1 Tax=Nocardia sp. NBC_01327 TaxID=2903593 RepID=UPI002E0D6CD2|nr:GNAT family N-acetyltransferase [Nocardia sp. NBC_01327]